MTRIQQLNHDRFVGEKGHIVALPGWKDSTVKAVAQFTGPVAELLVDDAPRKTGIDEAGMTAGLYIKFLQNLHGELPPEIDRNKTCQIIKVKVLSKYGF